jgi:hypothetical protein
VRPVPVRKSTDQKLAISHRIRHRIKALVMNEILILEVNGDRRRFYQRAQCWTFARSIGSTIVLVSHVSEVTRR